MEPKRKNDLFVILGAIVLAVLLLVVVSPFGNFPMDDDWTQSLVIHTAIADGEWFYPKWLSAYTLPQILFGTILTYLFGFSFSILRLMTLVLGWVSGATFYLLLRRQGSSLWGSVLGALLLIGSPIFFFLSHTFMSDIYAMLFFLVAVYLYDVGFQKKKLWLLFIAGLFVVCGFLSRQIVILLLPAATGAYFLTRALPRKHAWWIFGAPLLVAGAFVYLAKYLGIQSSELSTHILSINKSFPRSALLTSWYILLLLGFAIIPATSALCVRSYKFFTKSKIVFMLGVFVIAVLMIGAGHLFGSLGNIITPYGLGPTTHVLQGSIAPWWPDWVAPVLTILSAMSAGVFILFLAQKKIQSSLSSKPLYLMLWIFAALYWALLLFLHTFDRYTLFFLPTLIIIMVFVLDKMKWSRLVAGVLLTILILFSVMGTKNAQSWNTARWQLGKRLIDQNILVEDIEAGYEWNGWHLYKQTRSHPLGVYTPEWAPWYVQTLFPGHSMRYIISFSPLGGYAEIDKEPVHGIFSQIDFLYTNEIRPGSLE